MAASVHDRLATNIGKVGLLRPGGAYFWPHTPKEVIVYVPPTLERLGTVRDLTLAGSEFSAGDGANPYHRYTQAG